MTKSALDRLGWLIGTGLGSGLAPLAPGTVGSLVAILIYSFAPIDEDSVALYGLIGVGFIVGIWATGTLITTSNPDPGRAVFDEFVGVWVTCLFLPKSVEWMAAAFFCFRVLDVAKPWPIRRLERLHGGLGVMSDDLLAGAYGAALLNGLRLAFFD
ncbi:MAG: hypothetical protein BZY81_05100 [SAR202 cluster bacterium Io17-Chloro-G4]|nr:MAG: hypothetical protein BZY81_05100 [SAR202 cluster bacterium Io17-Chloro-G4]